jgi:hypothetical protein
MVPRATMVQRGYLPSKKVLFGARAVLCINILPSFIQVHRYCYLGTRGP